MDEGRVVGGRFRLEVLVGAGGAGRVYRAFDTRLGGHAAVKLIRGGLSIAERLRREVQLVSLLDHPGIVRYLEHGAASSDEYFLAMEWIDGESLASRLTRKPYDVPAAVALIGRVAEAVAHAHARQVVHRDLKPANLLLASGDPGWVKVVDFGIARVAGWRHRRATEGADGEMSVTGIPIGTLGYMAPEQARGERFIDARADVFALGCLLFECIAGRPPFAADHAVAVLAKILLEKPIPLGELAPVPAWLETLVASMLAHDPAERPNDAGVVARVLAAHEGRISSPDRPYRLTTHERRLTSVVALRPTSEIEDDSAARLARNVGAELQPLIDGSWVALLQGGSSGADSVTRAARLALGLRAKGAVSIATGFERVAAGASGDVIERAFAQLDETVRADMRGVCVDELTAGLTDGVFDFAQQGQWRFLLGPRMELDPRRRVLGRVTPFVGRDKDLSLLLSSLDDCLADSSPTALFVLGPAGIGKSRLRHEMIRAARIAHPSLTVMIARADPTRQASALGLLGALVASEARIRDDDELGVRRTKLRKRLAQRLYGDTLERVVEIFGELAGAPVEEPSLFLQGAKDDPRRMWEQTRRAFADWVEAELRLSPLLLVIEDMQWADAHSMHLVAELLSRKNQSLMLLGLARPEAQTLVATSMWDECSPQIVRLKPLGRRASEQLIRDLLGPQIAAERIETIVDRAGGHAFFLEELVRAEAEGHGQDTPLTMVAMLQERIERYEGDARRLLRAASVFGLEFCKAGLAALVGDAMDDEQLQRWIETLQSREIIGVAEQRRFNREETFAFRHDLVHEAIYATLTEDDRRRGHLLVARWLEADHERDWARLAEHFERGGDEPNAARAFAHAAEQAFRRQDFEVALRLVDRGTVCGAGGATLGLLRWIQGNIAMGRHTFDDTERYSAEAMELLPPGTTHWYHAATVMVTVAGFGRQSLLGEVVGRVFRAGDPDPAHIGMAAIRTWALTANMLYFAGQYSLAAEFDSRVERWAKHAVSNEASAAAWVHFARHVQAGYCGGDPELTLEEAARSAAVLEQSSDEVTVWLRIEEAKAAALIGDFARGERLLAWAFGAAGEQQQFASGLAQHRLARIRSWCGALDEAMRLELAAKECFRRQGLPIMSAVADNHLALFLLAEGKLDEAAAVVAEAANVLYASPPVRIYALATAARIAVASQRTQDALSLMKQAEAERPYSGLINDGESPYDLAWIETLLACGETSEAAGRARLAVERLERRASTIGDDRYRHSFRTVVPENAQLYALASELRMGA